MKSRKLWISLALASALALSQAATAFAAPAIPNGGGVSTDMDAEREANGHTTISIMETAVDPSNVSFTVPLYVTMAVVSNDPAVKVPDNYKITNTTSTTGGAIKIGVTAMSFEKLKDSTYNTVAGVPAGLNDIKLSIGGMDMPALALPGISTVTIGGVLGTHEAPTSIAQNTSLDLALAGTVQSVERTDKKTAAQFRVKYTISMLNAEGKPLGTVYAGDDRTAAGLEPFTN